jgi:hypothetical protein
MKLNVRTRSVRLLALAALVAAIGLVSTAVEARQGRAQPGLGTVYVSSQGLYYDTFVTAETLPPHGPFQLLVDHVTEFGPGDPGYLGGRWQVPDGSGGYVYLLCPLLGPGRPQP